MLIYGLISYILSNAVTLRRDKSILFARISILILLYSVYVCYLGIDLWLLEKGIGLYGGLFHTTYTIQNFHIFIIILTMIILSLNSFYYRKIWIKKYSSLFSIFIYKYVYYKTNIINKMGEQFRILEYPLIILFVIIGSMFFISTSDLISIFLAIELQSYGLYLISTIYRNSELATTGGLIYFLLGSLSSTFILLATSLLYANSGTSNLDNIYIITSISEIFDYTTNIIYIYKPYYINISLIIMSVGFLFKISAAPFHFWSPDVYDAIPTIVTTFVAIIAKISILIFFLELVYYTNKTFIMFKFNWTFILLVSSLLSLVIGSILGLTQSRIKRLYAYSTISHIGFILLSLTICSIESFQAFVFYIMQYSISNLNAFILLISIGYCLFIYKYNENNKHDNLQDKNNSPIQLINDIKGFFYINPILSLSLAITLFSFIGVPPLIGFFAKQAILFSAINKGYIFMALIAILTSVISAVYYLVLIKQIFFEKPEYNIDSDFKNSTEILLQQWNPILKIFNNKFITNNLKILKKNILVYNIKLSSYLTIIISILTLISLLFIFLPEEWLNITSILSLVIFKY